MTEEYLKSLIDKLNRKENDELIQLRPLDKNVDFAKVWTEKPNPEDNVVGNDGPHSFYFIKNSENFYVAIVLDMRSDLHWFVANEHRGQGHLTKAMRKTILFHLFQNRDEQKVTITMSQIGELNKKASENVAFSLGFVKAENDDYILKKEGYKTDKNIYGQNTEITDERLYELRKKIFYLTKSLWQIHTEIEMKLGDIDYVEDLKYLVDELKNHTWKLEDAVWESRKEVIK